MIHLLTKPKLLNQAKKLSTYIALFICGYLTQVFRVQGVSGNLAMVDPNLYLGYAHIGSSLYQGIGETYYQHRVGWIFPLRVSLTLFGDSGPIYLMRSLAGFIPVIAYYFLSSFTKKLNFLVALSFGLAIICLSPIQSILSQTYTAAASFILLFLFVAHLAIVAENGLTKKMMCIIGFEIATLFAIHEFNLVLIVFVFFFTDIFLISKNPSRNGWHDCTKMNLKIAGSALIGLFFWELVYNFHYKLFNGPESFVLSSLRISRELTRLNRWDSYPDFFETLQQSSKWLFLFVPLIVGSTATITFIWGLFSNSRASHVLVAMSSSLFFAIVFSSQLLHAPIFSESFYFALTLLVLLTFSVFVIINLSNQKIAVAFSIFPLLSLLSPSLIFNFTELMFRLDAVRIMRLNFDWLILIILPSAAIFLVKFVLYKRINLSALLFCLFCWIPAAAGINNAYLFNSYKQDIERQSEYLSDAGELAELWSAQDKQGLTAVWNDADFYLNPLQTTLMFGGTNLQGLGGSTDFPTLDNWNCGRFWGSRWVTNTCFINGRDLADHPQTIITIHNTIDAPSRRFDQVIAPWFTDQLTAIGYTYKDWGVFKSRNVTYVLWSR
jgi:hypothetical protein